MHLDTLGPAKLPVTFISGENALLWDTAGRTYWDFYGGHAVTLIGHGNARWREAIDRQARALSFFTTLADVPVRTRAAAALCRFVGMDVCWFVNSGSEANEAALKIARKATGRPVIVAMEQGFHGRTMGSAGVTWKHREDHLPAHGEVRFVPFGDADALAAALDETVAAVITEPVQGMAGVVVPPAGWLARVQELCKANGSLLICDEIQSGMGRMGVPLASHRDGVTPDLATVGKGVGGGFPVAAVLMSAELANTVKPGDHGTTFGGNPLACAAVEATLGILADDGLLAKTELLGEALHDKLGGLPGVVSVRGAGAWLGVVLDRPAKPVMTALFERGLPGRHVVRSARPAAGAPGDDAGLRGRHARE
jgi:acetylornithine/N-succinyldiaminopimelate aminotransferase